MEFSNIIQDSLVNLNPLMQATTGNKQMATNGEIMESIENLRRVLREQRLSDPQIDAKGDQISCAIDHFLKTSESCLKKMNSDQELQRFVNNAIAFSEKAKREARFNKIKYGGTPEVSTQQFIDVGSSLKKTVYQMFTSSNTRVTLGDIQKVIEKFYTVFQQFRGEGKSFSEISDATRKEMIQSILTVFTKTGNVSAAREFRDDILNIFDYWRTAKENVSPSLQSEFSDLFDQGLSLLGRFTELDVFVVRKRALESFRKVENDKELQTFVSSMRKWVDDVTKNPEWGRTKESAQRGDDLLKNGMKIVDKHYDSIKIIFEDVKELLTSLQREEFIVELKDNIDEISKSLKGSYLDTLIQLRTILAPVIGVGLDGVKLGRIQEIGETSAWVLDNLILNTKKSHLDDISVDFKVGIRDVVEVTLEVKDIEIFFKDVDFAYERTFTPTWADAGKLDFRIASPGWKLRWIVNQKKGQEPFFELKEVKGTIKELDVWVKEANHSWIDSILVQLWTPSFKRRARESIEQLLRQRAVPMTDSLNKFFANSQGPPTTSQSGPQLTKGQTRSHVDTGEAYQAAEKTEWTV